MRLVYLLALIGGTVIFLPLYWWLAGFINTPDNPGEFVNVWILFGILSMSVVSSFFLVTRGARVKVKREGFEACE